ncbi:hypothetical protein MJO29_008536 [Puccinia striiformis f. sp. tritici]|uniref:hypothetical protein n=1 Tax=Puccinia striiformis f. sp. tritici TaxID=168172 RepID=UPI00200898FD|nr:hypothetical protein Pst134EA_015292 [Puccinia striiformis f. sp. tritici]KAH9463209.1 hypothetical protein Pst134EA_015292 [Puccinia striiformis f. sp. tritici]KAI7952905.1 hypothetical protein MJO29_008536 [Puccinia striiformis f. sp. tritici]
MSTRATNNELLPIVDPEQLIRAARAATRKSKLVAASEARVAVIKATSQARKSRSRPPSPQKSSVPDRHPTPSPTRTVPESLLPSPFLKPVTIVPNPTTTTRMSTGNESKKPEGSKAGDPPAKQSTDPPKVNAEAEWVAAAKRFELLEQAYFKLSVALEQSNRAPTIEPGRVDLARIRLSDGPTFHGPCGQVEPFLKWIRGVQVFFSTKRIVHGDDKIGAISGLIEDTSLQSFYHNEADKFLGKPWKEFKDALFTYALPPGWRTSLKEQILHLKMGESEPFLAYSTRARTLQSLHNFDDPTLTDFDLAQSVTFGAVVVILQSPSNNS